MILYQHRRHNKNLLMVHLIFVTKYRHRLLYGNFCDVKRMGFDVDHVHILLQYNPTDSISRIVSILKQYSAWHSWKNYGDFLSNFYWKERTLWSDGYFAASVGTVSQEGIERYIENQG